MSKQPQHPFDTPPERPTVMTFATGLNYDEDYYLTIEVYSRGPVHLVGDPLDHPLKEFTAEDAWMFRQNAKLFAWIADVLEAGAAAPDDDEPEPAAPPVKPLPEKKNQAQQPLAGLNK